MLKKLNLTKKIFTVACISAVAAFSSFNFSDARAADAVEKVAPEFSLKGSDGKEYKLSDYSGQVVVLEWLNHECPFVRKHYESKNMQQLQTKYTEQDVVWFSIISSAEGKQGHVTPEEAMADTKEKGAKPTAVLIDADGVVGKLYGAKTTPHMFIIDEYGNLVYQGAIDSINSADKADVAKAENYVSKALDEILADKEVSVSSTRQYGCGVKY